MNPRDATRSALQSRILATLASRSNDLVRILRELIDFPYPDDFWQLDFEIHDNDHPEILIYFYRDKFEQVLRPGGSVMISASEIPDGPFAHYKRMERECQEANSPPPSCYPFHIPSPLFSREPLYPSQIELDIAPDPESDNSWVRDAAIQAVIDWFRACWIEAGGTRFRFRAFIGDHDASERLDLRSGEWCDVE